MWRNRLIEESGAALVFALLAVIMLGGLAVMFTVRAVGQARVTGAERDFESAIHVAEAGVDDVIVELNEDRHHITEDPAGNEHEYTLSPTASEDDQRAWALAIASARDASGYTGCTTVVVGRRGEACGIRPIDQSTGDELPWVYGVGFIPDRPTVVEEGRGEARVIKIQFDKGFESPDRAIKTNGDLTVGGSLAVAGVNGSVHTNGDLTVVGSAVTATGPVTSYGSYGGDPNAFPSGSGQVTQADPVDPVYALAVYRGNEDNHLAQDNAALWDSSDPDAYVDDGGAWFDLCSDGTIHAPYFDASGEAAPCQGSRVLYDSNDPAQPAEYNGWSFNGDWNAGGGAGIREGVYYVHESNARLSGKIGSGTDPLRITIVADAHGVNDPEADPPVDTTCTGPYTGAESGSIHVTGTGSNTVALESYYANLLFLADRDISIQGNSNTTVGSSDHGGVILAHEQGEVTGNPTVYGGLQIEDACDTVNSPVHTNKVSGNFTLTFDGTEFLPFPSKTRITAWNEF